MSRDELLAILRKNDGDYETLHIDADEALLEYINDPEITEAFESVRRWYA